MQRRPIRRKAALAVALVAGAVLSAAPASADCVSAEASYKRPNQTKQYVVGPKMCIVPTPWNETAGVVTPPTGNDTVVLVQVGVWVPAP